jgi:hypothetical protein
LDATHGDFMNENENENEDENEIVERKQKQRQKGNCAGDLIFILK